MTLEQQRALVRDLARRYMEIATSDEMKVRERRWRDNTSGRKPDRSPVWLNLNACRREVQPEEELQCEDHFLRSAEDRLRWAFACHDLGDDTVQLPEWPVSAAVGFEGEYPFGVPTPKVHPTGKGGAWRYDPVIKDEKDLDKLRIPQWRHNEAETARRRQQAEELLGDIIPVRVTGNVPIRAHLDKEASDLIGMDALMLNLALNPEMIHRLMAFLRDYNLNAIKQVEAMGLLTENNSTPKHFSDSIRKTPEGRPLKVSDLWAWANSQSFELVGPDQFREFQLEYQRPFLEKYGAVNYGCCENLTLKIDHIWTLPNLRVFTNSPWTKLEVAAPKCAERGLCMEWRQLATDMTFSPDFGRIEKKLKHGLDITRGINRFIVLQEVQTIDNDLPRFKEWARRAIRLCEEDAA